MYLLADNAIYTSASVYLESFDVVSGVWITDRTLDGFQGSAEHTIVLD